MSMAIGVALLLGSSATNADQSDPRLAELFSGLLAAEGQNEADRITDEIWTIWVASDDETANELMSAGVALMALGRPADALLRFDKLVEIAPKFAEAWNKRATVHYLLDNYQESVDDIERTLELEPRHFGALSGLGLIYMETGDEEIAIRAFEGALKVHPYLPGARHNIEILNERLQRKEI
ncbi:MAG: tetratricopeptide repeat protein [Alphaproteobacteria bacterium]|nr:tetratricopeptide repeat protein [Alphaproteobacteria bacterium]